LRLEVEVEKVMCTDIWILCHNGVFSLPYTLAVPDFLTSRP
jgi:hypothetical protein